VPRWLLLAIAGSTAARHPVGPGMPLQSPAPSPGARPAFGAPLGSVPGPLPTAPMSVPRWPGRRPRGGLAATARPRRPPRGTLTPAGSRPAASPGTARSGPATRRAAHPTIAAGPWQARLRRSAPHRSRSSRTPRSCSGASSRPARRLPTLPPGPRCEGFLRLSRLSPFPMDRQQLCLSTIVMPCQQTRPGQAG